MHRRKLNHDQIVENRRINRNLVYGSLIAAVLSMVPPVVLPLDETKHKQGITQHRDQNVALYSLALGYLGMVFTMAMSEAADGRRDINKALSQLEAHFRSEDKNALYI